LKEFPTGFNAIRDVSPKKAIAKKFQSPADTFRDDQAFYAAVVAGKQEWKQTDMSTKTTDQIHQRPV